MQAKQSHDALVSYEQGQGTAPFDVNDMRGGRRESLDTWAASYGGRAQAAMAERMAIEDLRRLPASGALVKVDHGHPAFSVGDGPPTWAWRSRAYIVQLYEIAAEGAHRITVGRSMGASVIRPGKRDTRPMSWDELTWIKGAIGFGDHWCVEIYPPAAECVTLCNLRHLWVLGGAPPFGWRKDSRGAARPTLEQPLIVAPGLVVPR